MGQTKSTAQTNLAQAIAATDASGAYDTNVKYLLADRQILARILKYAVGEFAEMPVEEIMESIGDDIEVEARPVDPGLSNLGRIRGTNTEDAVPGEGKIIYDIRFSAYHKEDEMKFLLNIEAQKSADPGKLGYHLENRISYYLARMMSAQKYTEFFHSDYDNLKKVRSIWICMGNEEDGDSIEELGMEWKPVFGKQTELYHADLMRAVVIRLRDGADLKESGNILIAMLETLLSQRSAEEKKQAMEETYGMVMTMELDGRIQAMCNLSENIETRGIEKGIEEGKKRERIDAIRRIIQAGATKAQIISYGYTEEEFSAAEESLCVNV